MASKELRVLLHLHDGIAFRGLSSEEVLFRFLDQRDEHAFEELLRRHGKAVYLQCLKVLRSVDLVHEAFQTTFVKLALKGHTIKHQGNVGGWLVRTARNGALNIQRGLKTRQKIEQSFGAELADAIPDSKVKDLAQHSEVFALLSQLPENYRAVLTLCVIHGATHAEAASKLRWPVGTVATRVSKGLEMLKKKLERKGWGAAGVSLPAILASNVEAVPPDVSSAVIETAMKTMTVHTGWKVLVAGLWGVFLGYWVWVVAGVMLLGLAFGTLAYANRPVVEAVASASSPVSNVKLLKLQIRQRNMQVFREVVIPKVVAASQSVKLWNQPVKVIDVAESDFLLMFMIEMSSKLPGASKPWLTTRMQWHYNVLNGYVHVNLDEKNDGHARAMNLSQPLTIDNPWTGKRLWSSRVPSLDEAVKAFELLTHEPFEIEPECVKNDPRFATLKPYLGEWQKDNDKGGGRCFILFTEDGKPQYVDSDGRIFAVIRSADNLRWDIEGWSSLVLSEDKQRMDTTVFEKWRR